MNSNECWLEASTQALPVKRTRDGGEESRWNARSQVVRSFVGNLSKKAGRVSSLVRLKMTLRKGVSNILLYVAVGLVASACYLNSLGGHFVHDDVVAITRNPDVLGQTSLYQLFLNDFWGTSMADPLSHKSYRPLTVLTFRWNMAFGGLSVEGYHLVNVLLHGLVVCLFTCTCRTILRWNIENAAVVGLLFAVHPVHTEAVSSTVGRAELLCAFFFFVSFLSFYKWKSNHHQSTHILPVCTFISAFLALLAKEQGVTVLAVSLGYHLATLNVRSMKRPNRGRTILIHEWLDRYTIFLLVGLVVLLSFRTWMLRGSLPTFSAQDNPAAFSPRMLTRFLTKIYLVTFNAWLVLFPSNLSYDWQMGSIPLVETIWDKRNLGSVFLFGGIGAIFITSRITVKMRERILLSMALVVLIVPFLPASNLLVTVGFVVAERTLYIPSAGVYILVTHGLHRLRDLGPKATWVCRTSTLFVLTVFVWWTLRRNTVWESRASLFKSGIESVPQNAKVHYNYANLQKDLGNVETAIKHYRIALSLWPDYASAHNNLGTLLSDPVKAEHHFKVAIAVNSYHARAYFNLANLYSKQDKRELAESFLKRAIDIDPGFAEAYSALASLYAVFGHVIEAEKLHLVALSLSPDNVDALNNYGVFVQNLGREDEAVEFYQRAVRIHPNHTVALLNAARTLRSLKFIDDAEKLYKRALYIEEDPQVMDNLGTLYIKSGRFEEARKLYSELTQKHGSFLDGKIHYAQLLIQERSFYDAEALLQSVININATYREAYHQLAILFIETNRTSEGFESILQALRLCHVTDKSCAQLYVCHGDLVKDMDDLDTAAQSYTIAIQLDPGIGHAHINLGVIHHLKGRHLQALRHYRTAQNLDPQNPVVLENIEKLKKHQWKKSIRRCAKESECYQTW